MAVMFRFPIQKINDFTVEVQIPTGECGVPVLHGEFIELYRLSEEEIKAAQMAALRSVAILPAHFTQRALDGMNKDVVEREAESIAAELQGKGKKNGGKWEPIIVRPVEDKAK